MRVRTEQLRAVVLAFTALVSCGGSSSETPPPLEPHPLNLHYSRASTALNEPALEPEPAADAGVSTEPKPRDVDENEDVPAPRTWGGEPKLPPGVLK